MCKLYKLLKGDVNLSLLNLDDMDVRYILAIFVPGWK